MYFLLSKTVGIFAAPSNAIIGLMLCGLLLWPTRLSIIGKRIVLVSIFLLLIAGASPLGTALLLPLENRFPSWDSSRGPPTGLVVLGGVISPDVSVKRSEVSLGRAAERLLATVELYRRYPTARIIFTGGNSNVIYGGLPESDLAARFLENLGVPHDHIEIDRDARNTMENAINAKRLAAPKPGERWLLITSASHMPRAIGLFRETGFLVEAYPADWQTGDWGDMTTQSFSLLGGLVHLDTAAHEWVALVFDRMSGRTSTLFPGP
jgi:uncharacterized SAM-binding protein YcdF (DUF218 family)